MTHPTDEEPIELAEHTWRHAGGRYVTTDDGTFLRGAMYVERYVPRRVTEPYPVVMFHGGGQTGSNFVATPDGRRGWLHDFLRAGFTVYIVDQPERARSGHALEHGAVAPMARYSVERVQARFTACAQAALWPQSALHTGWPGSGLPGDPAFDRFYAAQVQMLADGEAMEAASRDAGVALLDDIGPAILLTHSQSGPFGWLIGDARPERVRAILAIEPNGPPFHDIEFRGGEDWYRHMDRLERPFGISRAPLHFEPKLDAGESLGRQLATAAPEPGAVRGYLQPEPARQLPRLAGLDILIVTAEASYHAPYDQCTSAFLAQAGVEHDCIRLVEHGLKGDGHMIMLEANNHLVADRLIAWIKGRAG